MFGYAATNRSTRYAPAVAAGLILLDLFSPAAAAARPNVSAGIGNAAGALATDDARHAAVGKPDRNRAAALTSHLPWAAPVGHRQPRRDEVPPKKTLSAREPDQQLQQLLDLDIDRKLIICRC
jgi:hypothetical protein